MTTPHQTTKECLIRNFQELNEDDEVFTTPNYQAQLGIALAMLNTLNEVETARKMFSDIYESMLMKRPNHLDWFIQYMKKTFLTSTPNNNSEFDKLIEAIYYCNRLGHEVEYAVSKIHDTLGHIIEVQYTPKQSNFIFNSILNYDQVLTAVSEFKDTALIDTCDFGVPEHKEIPVMYDLNDMSLEDICQAYLNMGGQPLIIEP
jgi:hypothetical protein